MLHPTCSPPTCSPHHTVALRNLSTRQQSLEVQAKEVKARLASEQAQVAELQHALGALQEQEQSLPQRVDQLSRVLETKEANIATREKGRLFLCILCGCMCVVFCGCICVLFCVYT